MPHRAFALRGRFLLILCLGAGLKLASPASSQTCPLSQPQPGSKAVRGPRSSLPGHAMKLRPSQEPEIYCPGTCRKQLPHIRCPTPAWCCQGPEQCGWEHQADASQDKAPAQAKASQGKESERAGPSSSGQGWEATDVAGEYIVRFNDYRCALVLDHDMQVLQGQAVLISQTVSAGQPVLGRLPRLAVGTRAMQPSRSC